MKEEKIDITLNQEDVQNIIDCYEKDIELIEKLKERNKIYKTTIKGQHKTIIELRNAKKASKKVHKERNKKLKEENEQLKERIEYLERSNDRREETIILLRDETIELEEKIDNAIKYIERNKFDYEVKERGFYMIQGVVPEFRLREFLKGQLKIEEFERLLNGGKNE